MVKYAEVSTHLACLSNENLTRILVDAKSIHQGVGGKSVLIFINDTPVFVKKIPITDIERLPQHLMSTANMFDLPLYYQYGVGSTGFGVWRELAAHAMTTHWVISAECVNFPMMYHWRMLPGTPSHLNINYWDNLDNYTCYWENSSAIRNRIEHINKARNHIVVFLEYVPQNLHEWLGNQMKQDSDTVNCAINFVENNLKVTNHFMNTHGLFHFDTHFANILTDGETLFFSDFGLALSDKFELTSAEFDFLKKHRNYDQAHAALCLIRCIITSTFGINQWELKLRDIVEGEFDELTPSIAAVFQRYGAIALVMNDFLQKIRQKSKLTPYPASLLDTFYSC